MTCATSFDPRVGRGVRAGEKLVEQIIALADGHGAVIVHVERPWASATFRGTRHTLTIGFDGADAVAGGRSMAAKIAEHEFAIPGQIVGDAQMLRSQHRVEANLLLVELELLLLEDD